MMNISSENKRKKTDAVAFKVLFTWKICSLFLLNHCYVGTSFCKEFSPSSSIPQIKQDGNIISPWNN